jgi:hypothetical protein
MLNLLIGSSNVAGPCKILLLVGFASHLKAVRPSAGINTELPRVDSMQVVALEFLMRQPHESPFLAPTTQAKS